MITDESGYTSVFETCPAPQTQLVGVTYTQAECDEMCEIAERDGYEKAVQDIDQRTGGDGEYRYCLGMEDDIRHQPDAATMIQRIVDRFESLNLMDDATKEIKVSKDMVNAAWNAGKQRGMTGLPEDFRQVLKAALAVVESIAGSEARNDAEHQARVDQFSVMGSDWAEPNYGRSPSPQSRAMGSDPNNQ